MENAQNQVAARLAANAPVLGILDRNYSFGPKNAGKNFVEEHAKALQVSWKIRNNTKDDVVICFSPFFANTEAKVTQFGAVSEILTLTGSTAMFATGTIIDGDAGADVTVASTKSGRVIEHLLRYAGQSPLRFTKWSMKSRTIAGEKESSNYDNTIKSFWVTPFDVPVIDELELRPLQKGDMNFNPDMLDVNFIANNFHAILSREHFLQIQVNAGTELSISAFIGAQDSAPQRFFRDIKKADDVLRPELLRLAK